MAKIRDLKAREILDSRGNPTIELDLYLDDGSFGRASAPSGVSTGQHEAIELRDYDSSRYGGLGVLKAIDLVEKMIKPTILGRDPTNQRAIDEILIDLDGTKNKARLGGNTILSVSVAVAKAAALAKKIPLYAYLASLSQVSHSPSLPVPLINVLNGGLHADSGLDFQEFKLVCHGFPNFRTAIEAGSEIFHQLKKILQTMNLSTGLGDEGGFAPRIGRIRDALSVLVKAIEEAGFKLEKEVSLAIDVAATTLLQAEGYRVEGQNYDSSELTDYLAKLTEEFPIISIEDGLAEDDWLGWQILTKRLSGLQLIGDDLFATNKLRIARGFEKNVANAVLIKPNQIGTVTETIEAIDLAKAHNYKTVVSHRSGDTADTFIADLACGLDCGQIKAGSVAREERVEKYNQLIRIEEELGHEARFLGSKIYDRGLIKNE